VTSARVVCDASAMVTVLLDSGFQGTWLADRLGGVELYAPTLLPFECSNIFRRHELGGLISADQAAQAHADLLDLPVDSFPYESVAQRVWELRHNLTSYDAAYVAVAELLDAPLITLDRRLSAAPGIRCSVEVPPDS
jgi:predicted nucleic acid-binding protein